MIRLQPSMIAGLDEASPPLQAVQDALQSAIELEHATIPVYLYALYSLDPAKNGAIARIIRSVVVEEMLHMALASNILNAIGGSPSIDDPKFIPSYPGPLPGGVEAQLSVSLEPFSTDAKAPFRVDQLETFLKIEEPEHPIEFPELLAVELTITIGQFYQAISQSLAALGDGAFAKPPRNQVGPDLMPGSIVVTDVATAQQAIQTIVQQGEGTKASPLELAGSGYAHYYRFMEVRKGHLLVAAPHPGPKPEDKYAYSGDPVPFDRKGVFVPTSAPPYAAGTAEALANDNFNYTYTALLKALHELFNGKATADQFGRCLGLMMSLEEQGKAMLSGIPNPQRIVGPTFEYRPTNPARAAA